MSNKFPDSDRAYVELVELDISDHEETGTCEVSFAQATQGFFKRYSRSTEEKNNKAMPIKAPIGAVEEEGDKLHFEKKKIF